MPVPVVPLANVASAMATVTWEGVASGWRSLSARAWLIVVKALRFMGQARSFRFC
jgi:hypothetical protein